MYNTFDSQDLNAVNSSKKSSVVKIGTLLLVVILICFGSYFAWNNLRKGTLGSNINGAATIKQVQGVVHVERVSVNIQSLRLIVLVSMYILVN